MAIRFRKSIRIAPGLRVNLSKSGVSASVGGNGLTGNIGKHGTRVTAGVPGSGLSASKFYKRQQADDSSASTGSVVVWLAVIGLLVWMIWG